jgi:lysophospholipase L1-like esterase
VAKGLKSTVSSLVLLGASLMLGLGAAEACLRVFPELLPEEAQLRLHWQSVNQPVSRGDPYLGHVFPPNHLGRIERFGGDFAFTFTTDEHGFRNPSPWPRRADIVVVGDSMAFGYGVGDDETWTALLADQLRGSPIINLGLVGAAPQQYLRIYETYGRGLQPALVLFCLFPGNDVGDAGLFDRWVKAGSQGNYLKRRFAIQKDKAGPSIQHLLQQSYLVSFLRYTRKNAVSRVSARTIDFPDGCRLHIVPTFYAEIERQTKPDHPNFRMVLGTVEQARALAEQNGSQLLVLLMPTKEEVYLPLLDDERASAIAPFVAAFDEAGIPYLDLTPHLQARARQGERLFFEIDGHPNAAGHRLIAEVILDHLRRHPQRHHLKAGIDGVASEPLWKRGNVV